MTSHSSLYLHIPFCASRCIYCGFYSTTQLAMRERYVHALCQEMEILTYKPNISTVYLGGGTPSQLTQEQLTHIFDHIYNKVYSVENNAEVTMECNPDDIRHGMFNNLPVNRVSMGAQTFSDERLRFLHRRHTAKDVDKAVDIIRRDGINNISIDLMFGFPGETLDDWKEDIRHAISICPEHISAYSLMYEDGTKLHQLLEQGKVKETDEEVSVTMYSTLIDMLTAVGYEHYEISNFARTDGEANSKWRSQHNSNYWHDTPYIGLGAGAHSYYNGKRHWNPDNITQYISEIENGHLPYEEETIDTRTHYNDIITTALRTREGIDLTRLTNHYKTFLLRNAEDYVRQGLLLLSEDHLSLSRNGINISNIIMSDLMEV